ncbi:PIN domain-containing protein [Patescibacteria group bacterium]|nr:PIN domain-containing protein [Patescibacteria group bacterium]MBU4512200.1 PIN domain-containing protein [Patescibacteria group bacterium]MCG2693451.1 PIN domain-containing protein [Candidatus Parcubacteria bacterium]
MIILDSNIWIALLNIDDSDHARAQELMKDLEENIIVTEHVLLEVATIISQKVDKDTADNFIKRVISTKEIEIFPSSEEFLDRVIKFYLSKSNRNLSFVDYSLLLLSKRIKVITFDKILKKELAKVL